MKRWMSLILVMAMLLALAACGGTTSDATEGTANPAPAYNLADVLRETADYLYQGVKNPSFGSVGGEWTVLGLARSGLDYPEEYFETYFQNISAYTAQQGGVLHAKKYTDYSRVILAVTAIGRDPRDIGGYNLLEPLADFEQTVFQGINGPVFALLALDSGNYEIPGNAADSTQATRDLYVDYIINAQLPDGGWSLAGGEAEIDLTAMALQALARYTERNDVAQAVEKALALLSARQSENGGYGFNSGDEESSESVAQVIVALTELGISPEDGRFVKNGHTLLDALMEFRREDGGFSHDPQGSADLLATEQAFYALVALERMEQGKSTLYRMSD